MIFTQDCSLQEIISYLKQQDALRLADYLVEFNNKYNALYKAYLIKCEDNGKS